MIRFYNTLTRKKEDFKSIEEKKVKVYSCGPTVYSFQHIGNMRAVIFSDLLKRSLRYFGYEVYDVLNITDVGHLVSDEDDGEDKMLKAAKKEKKNPYEIARFYEDAYFEDLKRLNVILPKIIPRATEHIDEQLFMIEELSKKGFTYKTEDGIYFDVSKFKEYGKLSGQKMEDKMAGARVALDSSKKNPYDFALWKFLTGENKEHIMKWDSRWGLGFPGWHIECSAMSHKYLGSEFDIHTGGIDHIPIHHENEIAQNVCSGMIRKVNFWMHNAHLLVDSRKMSKSLGNVYTLSDIMKMGYSPLAFRELCLRTHYRKTMNFTLEALESAEQGVRKINEFYSWLRNLIPDESSKFSVSGEYLQRFKKALEDDLNSPLALSVLYDFISDVNKEEGRLSSKVISNSISLLEDFDRVLGLLNFEEFSPEILELARLRQKARLAKDFSRADLFREELLSKGVLVRDDSRVREGFVLERRN